MKTLIIYDSYYGNTQKVAQLYHEHLSEIKPELMKVDVITEDIVGRFDCFIIGAPTRAFNMTSKIKKMIRKMQFEKKAFHVFDTRADATKIDKKFLVSLMKRFGYAAEKMQAKLAKKNANCISDYKYYFVKDTEGPLISETEKEVINNCNQLLKILKVS